jgi:hypothetical protein
LCFAVRAPLKDTCLKFLNVYVDGLAISAAGMRYILFSALPPLGRKEGNNKYQVQSQRDSHKLTEVNTQSLV